MKDFGRGEQQSGNVVTLRGLVLYGPCLITQAFVHCVRVTMEVTKLLGPNVLAMTAAGVFWLRYWKNSS